MRGVLLYVKIIFNSIRNLFFLNAKLLDDDESIEKLLKTRKGIVRYGDGELGYMLGRDVWFQKQNKELKNKLFDIFNNYSNESKYFIATPNRILKENNRIYGIRNKFLFFSNLKNDNIYLSSFCFRHASVSTKNLKEYGEKVYHLLKNKNIIIVGDKDNVDVKIPIKEFIETPSKEAFEKYDDVLYRILQSVKLYENPLVLVGCGIVATVLAAELNNNGILAYDIGTLFDPDMLDKSKNEIVWFEEVDTI